MAPVFGEKDMEEHCGDKAACIDEEREALNLKYSNNIVLFFFFFYIKLHDHIRKVMILHLR